MAFRIIDLRHLTSYSLFANTQLSLNNSSKFFQQRNESKSDFTSSDIGNKLNKKIVAINNVVMFN